MTPSQDHQPHPLDRAAWTALTTSEAHLGYGNAIEIEKSRNRGQIPISHSLMLLSYPNAKIILFDGSGLSEVAFEDTEHFAVTRDFLNHYPRRLEQLLQDDEAA